MRPLIILLALVCVVGCEETDPMFNLQRYAELKHDGTVFFQFEEGKIKNFRGIFFRGHNTWFLDYEYWCNGKYEFGFTRKVAQQDYIFKQLLEMEKKLCDQ